MSIISLAEFLPVLVYAVRDGFRPTGLERSSDRETERGSKHAVSCMKSNLIHDIFDQSLSLFDDVHHTWGFASSEVAVKGQGELENTSARASLLRETPRRGVFLLLATTSNRRLLRVLNNNRISQNILMWTSVGASCNLRGHRSPPETRIICAASVRPNT